MAGQQQSKPPTGTFSERVTALPVLGVGVSTEYGAGRAPGALDVMALRAAHPNLAGFLEVGVEVAKGLDEDSVAWAASGGRTTYHFLDINLDEPADFDDAWLDAVRDGATRIGAAWLCGDAGLWHHGPRDRSQMLLLPPVLCDEAASTMAEGIVRLREAVGLEVLPENPPGQVFMGDLHLLDFFGLVAERADTGILLDCAHLAIFQQAAGHAPLTGLDGFPLERVVELHVAGGIWRDTQGFRWIDDDHGVAVLPETWAIFEHVARRAPNLKAVVFECERNPLERCLPGLQRIADTLGGVALTAAARTGQGGGAASVTRSRERAPSRGYASLQRLMVRMLYDPGLVARIFEEPAAALKHSGLGERERRWLLGADRRAFLTDPMRPMRMLTALIEEFCVSSALATDGGARLERLAAFFGSRHFHDAIDADGVVAFAFARYLDSFEQPPGLRAMCALELALAEARRRRSRGRLMAGVAVARVEATTLASFQALRVLLTAGGEPPAQTLIRDGVRLPEVPAMDAEPAWLLVEGGSVSEVSAPLGELLNSAAEGASAAELVAVAARFGASESEARELLAQLSDEGLLRG